VIPNPSLAMACNAYRRLYGVWPEGVRFAPEHFAAMASEMNAVALLVLGSVLEVTVSEAEQSPRLTVHGAHGSLTYDRGVVDADHDQTPFDEWIGSEAMRRGIPVDSGRADV
jgi:hypothetical protein